LAGIFEQKWLEMPVEWRVLNFVREGTGDEQFDLSPWCRKVFSLKAN
jgi:hypothetical protein